MRIIDAVALQCSKIVGVSEFRSDLLEPLPIALRPFQADVRRQVTLQIGGDVVVVEQRVVHIEEKNCFIVRHGWSLHWMRLLSRGPIGCDGHLHVARQVDHLLHQASSR